MKNNTNKIDRLSAHTTAHYSSLENLRKEWRLEPATKKTSDKEKLINQQNKFLGTCKVCNHPLFYVQNSNVIVCKNTECKGIQVNKKDGTAEYIPVSRVLDERGTEIASALFDKQ